MEETRFKLGKAWKEGKAKGDFEKYFNEFKDSINKGDNFSKFKADRLQASLEEQ